eukprot:1282596-Pyramimonas_sp.AAC.1
MLRQRLGIFWTLENPLSSRPWEHELVRPFLKLPQSVFVRLDMCEFGAHFLKPIGLLGTLPGLLGGLCERCPSSWCDSFGLHVVWVVRGPRRGASRSGSSW